LCRRESWARKGKEPKQINSQEIKGVTHQTRPELRRRFEDHRRPFDTLRTGIEDLPVIVKILRHLGLPTRVPPRRRRVESIYSKRSEEPKTACQRKPTARAGSEFEQAAP